MARKKKAKAKRPIESYEHRDKERVNNPPVGLVTPDTDPDAGAKKGYAYDPHLDPQLQWAGKAEHTSFEVPTVSLHVHERIDPRTIIEAVRKRNGNRVPQQGSLFEEERSAPLRHAVEFYKHARDWSNRMVAGDSLLVMNSLLEKEGLAGKVQMIYIDPPYGIRYGSNFQPFVNKRDVKDGKDEDLTAEPEQIRAFRDTWELGIHSYLTYLRDRLLLARELLTDSGSIFVQISDENVHHLRELMDEVFGRENFYSLIVFQKTGGLSRSTLPTICDFILWYCKDKTRATSRLRALFMEKEIRDVSEDITPWFVEHPDGAYRRLSKEEKRNPRLAMAHGRVFRPGPLKSEGGSSPDFTFDGGSFPVGANAHWKVTADGMQRVATSGRMFKYGNTIHWKYFIDDYPVSPLTNVWTDTQQGGFSDKRRYVVQTGGKVIERCLLMTSDPGDLVLDPTCGSGTTAYVAEQWGRRWITCDTSRVALTLAKQRLMTAVFDYYELAHPGEGVGSGFKYKTVPHVTLKSIANNPDIKEGMTREQIDAAIARHARQETLYDQPVQDKKRMRVSGPFTVEAVPAPAVTSVEEIIDGAPQPADATVARSGETLRQGEWRDELLRTGIRGKAGQHIRFARLEPLPGCRWLHADGETRPSEEGADSVDESAPAYTPQRIVISFGPAHAPLEQRQVAQAIEEAQTLVPRPKLIVFAAFQFDPEAAKDIDETNWPGVTLLKAQMNADLLSVSVHGFDYFNTKTGAIESGSEERIAVWLLDTDYDGRSLYPRQVFFPMAGAKEGWARLAKNLNAEVDEELIEAYRGTVSLPFEPGEHRRIAVKIVDDRGIESLKVMGVE